MGTNTMGARRVGFPWVPWIPWLSRWSGRPHITHRSYAPQLPEEPEQMVMPIRMPDILTPRRPSAGVLPFP